MSPHKYPRISPRKWRDCYASARYAAESCSIKTYQVLAMIENKTLRPKMIDGRPMVSLKALELALASKGVSK